MCGLLNKYSFTCLIFRFHKLTSPLHLLTMYRVFVAAGATYESLNFSDLQGGTKKTWATGHPISLQIFRKLHDGIVWKLVDLCSIIC